MLNRSVIALTCLLAVLMVGRSHAAADSELIAPPPKGTGTIGAEVSTPGGGWKEDRPGGGGGSNGGGGPADTRPPYCNEPGADPDTCSNQPAVRPGDPAEPEPLAASVVAEFARDLVDITVPTPHTSPDGAAQITGLPTWFWLDARAWRSETARAELPGIWSEVTATPVRATWTPGDGGPPVTCEGPGRPHPGTSGATSGCSHAYTVVGTYTLQVAVTYEVTWRSSTGETGVQSPIVLASELPITVDQRQVVVS